MKKTGMMMAAVLAWCAAAWGAVGVANVKVQPREPWNGLVDIEYEVVCDDAAADVYVRPVGYDGEQEQMVAIEKLSGDGAEGPVKAGVHRMTWDTGEENGDSLLSALSVNLLAISDAAPYMVVDMGGGADAETWPVSYVAGPDGDGAWSDEYKTDKLVLRRILPGTFAMGSPAEEPGRAGNETQHEVTVSKPYYMGVFEVTQKQWELAMGTTPSQCTSDTRPVERVSYKRIRGKEKGPNGPADEQADEQADEGSPLEAGTAQPTAKPAEEQAEAPQEEQQEAPAEAPQEEQPQEVQQQEPQEEQAEAGNSPEGATDKPADGQADEQADDAQPQEGGTDKAADEKTEAGFFMVVLRAKTGLAFDLPTEAQWEYACRAGTTGALNSGKDLTGTGECANMAEVGRYLCNQSDGEGGYSLSAPVGSYRPNAWGLYDMHGNVWEWCRDWYGDYAAEAETDPTGAETGSARVRRGGGWGDGARGCRSASRAFSVPSYKSGNVGFRLGCFEEP